MEAARRPVVAFQLLLLVALQRAGAVSQHCRVTEVCRECRAFERTELPAACASTGHREEVSCPNPPSEQLVVYLRPCRARRNGFDDQLDDFARIFADGMRRFSAAIGWEPAIEDGELLSEMEETSMELHVEGGAAEGHSAPIAVDDAMEDSHGTAEVLRFELVVLALLALNDIPRRAQGQEHAFLIRLDAAPGLINDVVLRF